MYIWNRVKSVGLYVLHCRIQQYLPVSSFRLGDGVTLRFEIYVYVDIYSEEFVLLS
jgi:hypothetical protein